MEHRPENGEAGTPVVFKSALNSINTWLNMNIFICDFLSHVSLPSNTKTVLFLIDFYSHFHLFFWSSVFHVLNLISSSHIIYTIFISLTCLSFHLLSALIFLIYILFQSWSSSFSLVISFQFPFSVNCFSYSFSFIFCFSIIIHSVIHSFSLSLVYFLLKLNSPLSFSSHFSPRLQFNFIFSLSYSLRLLVRYVPFFKKTKYIQARFWNHYD